MLLILYQNVAMYIRNLEVHDLQNDGKWL